jgi:hypothetical protein
LRRLDVAAIALREMDATAVAGLERVRRPPDAQPGAAPQIEILTSGTTGPPKQFAIDYEVIARHYINPTPGTAAPGQDAQLPPTLLYFPLSNISGIYTTLPALLKGERAGEARTVRVIALR